VLISVGHRRWVASQEGSQSTSAAPALPCGNVTAATVCGRGDLSTGQPLFAWWRFELVARIRAMLRRQQFLVRLQNVRGGMPLVGEKEQLHFGAYRLEVWRHELWSDELGRVDLGLAEMRLLCAQLCCSKAFRYDVWNDTKPNAR
jgi:hypothetical protein